MTDHWDKFVRYLLVFEERELNEFKFALGQKVRLNISGEAGFVIGRAQYSTPIVTTVTTSASGLPMVGRFSVGRTKTRSKSMINGELLERRGWRRWHPHLIWCYGSARLLWSVSRGFIVNGRKRQTFERMYRDIRAASGNAWDDVIDVQAELDWDDLQER